MKIVIDARFYGLEYAGLGRYTINLVKNLAKFDKFNKYFLLLRRKYYDLLVLPPNFSKVLAEVPYYSLREQVKLPKIIASLNPDLVHFPHLNIPYFYKGKFVITIHDLIMHRQSSRATTLPLPLYYSKRIPYKIISKKAVLSAEKIIVPSIAVQEEITNYYKIDPQKIVVIYEGFDESFLESGFGSVVRKKYALKNKYFIYAGSVYPHKNIERLIEAIAFLNKGSDERIELVIAGSRTIFLKRLTAYIKRHNAGYFVKLLGFVPDKELASLYKDSIAFVYPSLSEGFGLQGIEAMASGTLVLASGIPVFKEIYKGNAIYFNPYDFTTIAKAMKDVLSLDQVKRQQLIKNSQKFIKHYSWQKMAKETLKIYNLVK